MGSPVRASGTWTVYQGKPWRVVGRVDGDTIMLHEDVPPPTPVREVPVAEVGPVEKVSTHAVWRDGDVVVGRVVDPGVVRIYSYDAGLAARESLHGDQYSGWTGVAPIEELENVEEAVKVLRNEGKQA